MKYNKDTFINDIRQSQLRNICFPLVDVHYLSNLFSSEMLRIVNNNVETKVVNENSVEWFNDNLRNLKREKIACYHRALLTEEISDWEFYKRTRNRYKKELVKSKGLFVQNKILMQLDQKAMWRTLKKYVLGSTRVEIEENIIFNGVVINNSKVIADEFNTFFINSVSEINQSIEVIQYVNQIDEYPCRFKFSPVNNSDLSEVLTSMKQKKDFNYMSPKMFLDAFGEIEDVLTEIVNKSLLSGCFPSSWKESLVSPIQKVKGSRRCEEYRPVNALPLYEKLIEKIVKIQLQKYIDNNNILIESQFGFRSHHSCESALNYVLINWKEDMAAGSTIIAVFLDLKRAFETIDRGILIQKLKQYGIREKEIQWFKSYLDQRTQRTSVNGKLSEITQTLLGVPQGSILGSVLFLLYINDVCKVLKHCKIVMFADDALIYIVGRDVSALTQQLQEDLDSISIWFKANKLKTNVQKTKAMIFKTQCNIDLSIDNENIEQVDQIKYLGVIIDQNLKFDKHVDYIVKKISKKVQFFRRIKSKLDFNASIRVYNVIIKPHFEYCSSVLFLLSQSNIYRLQKLQNKSMRIILNCNRYTSILNMLNRLEWLSVKQQLVVDVLLFVQKMRMGDLPSYFSDLVRYVGEVQPYQLRNVNNLRLPNYRNTITQNSVIYKGFQIFNSLPEHVKLETNFNIYKRNVNEFVKTNF